MKVEQYYGMYIDQKFYDNYDKSTHTINGVTEHSIMTYEGIYSMNYHIINTCQLILRPVSSMTEEEKEEYYNCNDVNCMDCSSPPISQILFCIDKGFDIFNLITTPVDGVIIAVEAGK